MINLYIQFPLVRMRMMILNKLTNWLCYKIFSTNENNDEDDNGSFYTLDLLLTDIF